MIIKDIKYNPRDVALDCYDKADSELEGWNKNNIICLVDKTHRKEKLEVTYEESQISYVKKYLGMEFKHGYWACPF
jgi:hypothetical protein